MWWCARATAAYLVRRHAHQGGGLHRRPGPEDDPRAGELRGGDLFGQLLLHGLLVAVGEDDDDAVPGARVGFADLLDERDAPVRPPKHERVALFEDGRVSFLQLVHLGDGRRVREAGRGNNTAEGSSDLPASGRRPPQTPPLRRRRECRKASSPRPPCAPSAPTSSTGCPCLPARSTPPRSTRAGCCSRAGRASRRGGGSRRRRS